jgi:hypothetical protein
MKSDNSQDGNHFFLETTPLKETKRLAAAYGCDIGVPNDAGIGNILMYTRVVEDIARRLGRPIKILTGRLNPIGGVVSGEDPFPLWKNNPFVHCIVDANLIDPNIMRAINREKDSMCQFGHMIENIAYQYGIRPHHLRPSIYLSKKEQTWALNKLHGLRRPIICIHPHGTSSPEPGHPWYEENWRKLLDCLGSQVTVLEIFKAGSEAKQLKTVKIKTKLRQMMALVWASDLFIGFDSAVAHIATAFELPAAVLWEPIRNVEIEERWQTGFSSATLSRWSYPQNQNLIILGDQANTIVNIINDWVAGVLNLVLSEKQLVYQ